jgi:hypothetical protein
MPVDIMPDDVISRCIIYARFFKDGLHTDSKLWEFGKTSEDGLVHESGVLRRIAIANDDVHRIGCGIAEGMNTNHQIERGDPKRRYYCGFRNATVGDLPLVCDEYVIHISNVPEGGEESHVDVALEYKVEGRNQRAVVRTDAGMALAERFGPPVSFMCQCDNDDADHPLVKYGPNCLVDGLHHQWQRGEALELAASAG